MDDLQLLALCIEMQDDPLVKMELAQRCQPVLAKMDLDEKVESKIVKKIGLDAWGEIHKIEGTILRLLYVYLGQVKTKPQPKAISPKDLYKMILAGKSTAYMAKKLGVHRDSVRRAIVKYGYVELYDKNRKKSKATRIVEYLEKDTSLTNEQLAKFVGTRACYVAKIRHTTGFTMKTKKPPAEYFFAKLAEGLCAKEIASELGLSHRTIQTYLCSYQIKVMDAPAYKAVPATKIKSLLEQNFSVEEIADMLCKAPSTIKSYIYTYKLNHFLINKYKTHLLLDKIKNMREQGYPNRYIAQQLEVSISYICAIVKKLGLPARKTRQKNDQNFWLWDEEINKS